MGIVNVTPDSFSGDGLLSTGDVADNARRQASEFVSDGADILDIGGESTRPGAERVSVAEEIARVVPAIAAIRRDFPEIAISIDTWKADVAAAALDAGADCVNDVYGLLGDEAMAPLVAARGCPVFLMHNRASWGKAVVDPRIGGSYDAADYGDDFLGAVLADLRHIADLARKCGIAAEKIALDPGIGFGKTVAQNLMLIDRLDRVRALGYPVLLGSSRKSFIGKVLDVEPDQRVEGTAASVAAGIMRGAGIVRVHDVRVMARVARMTDAILAAGEEAVGKEASMVSGGEE